MKENESGRGETQAGAGAQRAEREESPWSGYFYTDSFWVPAIVDGQNIFQPLSNLHLCSTPSEILSSVLL